MSPGAEAGEVKVSVNVQDVQVRLAVGLESLVIGPVYFLGRYGRRHELAEYPEASVRYKAQVAAEDLADIEECITVIAFTEHNSDLNREDLLGAARGGRHTELGYALARLKDLVIIGPRENMFQCLVGIEQFDNWTEFMDTVHSLMKVSKQLRKPKVPA